MLKHKLIRRILKTVNSHQSQERRGSPSEFIYSRKKPGRSSCTERPPLSAPCPTNTTLERYGQDTSSPFLNPPIFFMPINWQATAFRERHELQRSSIPKDVEADPADIKPNVRHASPFTYSGCFRSSAINSQSQPQGAFCQSQIQISPWGQPLDNSVLTQLSPFPPHSPTTPAQSALSSGPWQHALQARLHDPGAEAAAARDMGRVLAWVRTVGVGAGGMMTVGSGGGSLRNDALRFEERRVVIGVQVSEAVGGLCGFLGDGEGLRRLGG
jgi:hypothetical protein